MPPILPRGSSGNRHLLPCSQAPGNISQCQQSGDSLHHFVTATEIHRGWEKPTLEASPAKALHNCQPSLALAICTTYLAIASSRSLMACRSRSLVSLSSAAPRSRSRSSFSVVISTLSNVTCGQREGVKPRVAQIHHEWGEKKATWANLEAERLCL